MTTPGAICSGKYQLQIVSWFDGQCNGLPIRIKPIT